MPIASTQVQEAEQQVLSVLGSVKGRGTSGLDADQLQELNAAIELLEKNGGVSGGWVRLLASSCATCPLAEGISCSE